MSPSRLFAKSPGQKQQLPPSPPNSDDETSSDEDEDFSDSENEVSGGEDDRRLRARMTTSRISSRRTKKPWISTRTIRSRSVPGGCG